MWKNEKGNEFNEFEESKTFNDNPNLSYADFDYQNNCKFNANCHTCKDRFTCKIKEPGIY
jgi:hypothetical protein